MCTMLVKVRPHLNNHQCTNIKMKNIWIILRKKKIFSIKHCVIDNKLQERITLSRIYICKTENTGFVRYKNFSHFMDYTKKKIIKPSRCQSL